MIGSGRLEATHPQRLPAKLGMGVGGNSSARVCHPGERVCFLSSDPSTTTIPVLCADKTEVLDREQAVHESSSVTAAGGLARQELQLEPGHHRVFPYLRNILRFHSFLPLAGEAQDTGNLSFATINMEVKSDSVLRNVAGKMQSVQMSVEEFKSCRTSNEAFGCNGEGR